MRLHYKNPTWVNSTQVEPGFTLGNFFGSVNRVLEVCPARTLSVTLATLVTLVTLVT